MCVPIDPHIRAPELTKNLANVGAEALTTVITNLDHYLQNPLIQSENEVTYAPKLTPSDAEVDWCRKSSLEIYNLFRGLCGSYKLKTYFQSKCIDLDELRLIKKSCKASSEDFKSKKEINASTDLNSNYVCSPISFSQLFPSGADIFPGCLFYIDGYLCVKCCESQNEMYHPWIAISKVKVATKWMSAKDFYNGFLSKKKVKKDERKYFYKLEEQKESIIQNKSLS